MVKLQNHNLHIVGSNPIFVILPTIDKNVF